jgi:hypothetical protein
MALAVMKVRPHLIKIADGFISFFFLTVSAQPSRFVVTLITLLLLEACGNRDLSRSYSEGTGGTAGASSGTSLCSDGVATRPKEWTLESHCPGVAPNYSRVFDPHLVHRIDVGIAAEDFAKMQLDLKKIQAQASGDLDGIPTPLWVSVTVTFDNRVWTKVGMRWKGHASLTGAMSANIDKLSFVLDFDKQENNFPELINQRFYGFKQLNFASGYNDVSLIREKTAYDLFRAASVPVPRTAFSAVYLDTGKDPVYYGVYTLIEEPADAMLKEQFGDGSGNLYKPWGNAARWLNPSELSEAEVKTYFEKETNKKSGDWTDVLAALSALYADRTDALMWRRGLEKVFDVPLFLRVLAVNQMIVNWDSYGCMHHNYLLYANPKKDSCLSFLPWDLNEALTNTTLFTCPPPGSLLLEEVVHPAANSTVDDHWPLIKFILGDTNYRDLYLSTMKDVYESVFSAVKIKAAMQADHDLIAPYVVGPEATEEFPRSNTTREKFNASLTGTDENGIEVTSVADPLFIHVDARAQKIRATLTENGM